MNRYRDPDRNKGLGYMNAGEILRGAARIAQLDDAVPDEQARHQQSRERWQEGCPAHAMAPFRIYGIVDARDMILSGVFEHHPLLTLANVEFELAWPPPAFRLGLQPSASASAE